MENSHQGLACHLLQFTKPFPKTVSNTPVSSIILITLENDKSAVIYFQTTQSAPTPLLFSVGSHFALKIFNLLNFLFLIIFL